MTQDEQTPDEQTPPGQTPDDQESVEQPSESGGQAPEEQAPREREAEEQQQAEERGPEEGGATGSADQQAEQEAPAPDAQPSGGKAKKEEVVPGAELDPIAIEPERQLDAEEQARREAEEEERLRRERALIDDAGEESAPLAAQPAKLSGDARFTATGKRKSSVARVILLPGSGEIQINKRTLEEYFPRPYLQSVAKQPLTQSGYEANVDVRIRVHGGGISGQAAAIRHGIARALTEVDPALRGELKRRGMLTRDARVKERRKAGLKKARKRPQFSKR